MAAGSLGTGFPANLKGFGYGFSKEGKLRKFEKSTGEPGEEGFQFQVSDDGDYNQRHYEALGDVITEYVYDLLETEVGLVRLPVPVNPDHPSTFIFASPNALTADAPLVILVHGSGVVRAGQWARSLIINDSLQSGTQIPYIKKAREMGYEVLITNSNENSKVINGKRIAIKGSSNAVAHVSYVWKNYIQGAKSNQVLIVAHSYGGHCIVELASRNWVSSDLPLDEPESTREGEIPRVSAGTVKHELTSWSCLQSVFAFFEAALRRTRRHDDL